ncbi:hypothetical protein QBC40DRAFT_274828 [Triangularia verruculosa]|uniref:Clavaminate synthase-like protein n=1 Tax=Triangularia verruculosa TaxID=2587418 RepID=A0AAN7AXP7_9PEZI|nr:hypothetical protein QBC40DRAFT_274828 [Triangularia verruculosa]
MAISPPKLIPDKDFDFITYPGAPEDPPRFELKASSTWMYCGPLLHLDGIDAPKKLDGLQDDAFNSWKEYTLTQDTQHLLLPRLVPFLKAVEEYLVEHGFHHYWLAIRASKPNHEFDVTRWHTDENFYNPSLSSQTRGMWKLCTTLQGPGTLFAVDGDHARELLNGAKARGEERLRKDPTHVCVLVGCGNCGRTTCEIREEMRDGLADKEVRQSIANKEMVFFRVGALEGAVHSEPPIDSDRIFINVIPGEPAQLMELTERWGMKYPRSWSLGVPLVFGGDERRNSSRFKAAQNGGFWED